jgi:hypothetical protein
MSLHSISFLYMYGHWFLLKCFPALTYWLIIHNINYNGILYDYYSLIFISALWFSYVLHHCLSVSSIFLRSLFILSQITSTIEPIEWQLQFINTRIYENRKRTWDLVNTELIVVWLDASYLCLQKNDIFPLKQILFVLL